MSLIMLNIFLSYTLVFKRLSLLSSIINYITHEYRGSERNKTKQKQIQQQSGLGKIFTRVLFHFSQTETANELECGAEYNSDSSMPDAYQKLNSVLE